MLSKPVPDEPSETTAAIQRLQREIKKLTLQQQEALRAAMYIGMTSAEAKEYDDRRERIVACVQDLKTLEALQAAGAHPMTSDGSDRSLID